MVIKFKINYIINYVAWTIGPITRVDKLLGISCEFKSDLFSLSNISLLYAMSCSI